jgi:hypothetical protein
MTMDVAALIERAKSMTDAQASALLVYRDEAHSTWGDWCAAVHETAVRSGRSVESDTAYAVARAATDRLIGVRLSSSDWLMAQIGNAPESWYEGADCGRRFADVVGRAAQAIVLEGDLEPAVFHGLTNGFAVGLTNRP